MKTGNRLSLAMLIKRSMTGLIQICPQLRELNHKKTLPA
jgi:hypothetical protein